MSILPFLENRLHSETVPGPDRCLLSRTQNAPPRPAPPLQCFTRLVARSAIETTIVFFLLMHFASEFHLNLPFCPSHPFRFCLLKLKASEANASELVLYNEETNSQRSTPIPWRARSSQQRLAASQLVLLSLPKVSLLSGVSPCPELEAPGPSRGRESESQASAVASLLAPLPLSVGARA